MPLSARFLIVFCVAFFVVCTGRAQVAGTIDTTFTASTSGGNGVAAIAVQPDGRILIAGQFTSVNGEPRSGLARLKPDGSLDETFLPVQVSGLSGSADQIALQPDGRIILAGGFTAVNGFSRNRIARLNADGSLESPAEFRVGGGPNTDIYCVTLQPDGKILLGGAFTSFSGTSRPRIVRLLPDGAPDPTFNVGSGPNLSVSAISVQPDGKIVIGGYFLAVNNQTREYIARLHPDGALESTATFAEALSQPSDVRHLVIQADGKIPIFTNGGRIRRLNANGTLETTATFDPGTSASNTVSSCIVQTDGQLVISGSFTTVNAQSRRGIARLNVNGSVEGTATFNVGTGVGGAGTPSVGAVASQPDGKLILGGGFTSFNGQTRINLVRLHNGPGTQTLTVPSPTQVQWMRSGALAEVQHASMEWTIDGGVTWKPLAGPVTRVAGGWQLDGIDLTGKYGSVRARGFTASTHSSNTSIVEQTQTFNFDTATDAPTLLAPAADRIIQHSLAVSYVLPEAVRSGSVKLIFQATNPPGPPLALTLATAGEGVGSHEFVFDPADPLASGAFASGAPIPDGIYSVWLSYQDALDHPAAASAVAQNVTADTTPPELTLPGAVTVEAADAAGAAVAFNVMVADALDPAPALSVAPASGSVFPIGTTAVNVSTVDWAGNTRVAAFDVTVRDTTPPEVGGDFAPLVFATGPDGTAVMANFLPQVTANDAVGVVSITQDPAAGTALPAGLRQVTIAATDAAGNAAFHLFEVLVNDATLPALAPPPGGFTPVQIVADDDGTTALPDYASQAVASDNVGIAILMQSPAPETRVGFGKTLVTLTATDAAGNSRALSFEVLVTLDEPVVTTVATVGAPVPGAGVDPRIPADAIFSKLGLPCVSDDRGVAFRGTWKSASGSAAGIFAGNPATLLVRTGDLAPGMAGGTFRALRDPVVAPDGTLGFAGTAAGPGIRATNNDGLWLAPPGGAPALVLREGAQIVGAPDRFRLQSIAGFSARNGELLVSVTLAPAGLLVTATSNTAMLRVTTGGATLLVRKGDKLDLDDGFPAANIKQVATLLPVAGTGGHGRWHADGTAAAEVTLVNGRRASLFFASDGSITRSLAVGDGVPNLPASAILTGVYRPCIAPAGEGAAARGLLTALEIPGLPPAVEKGNDMILLQSPNPGAPFVMFAREGAPAPGVDGAVFRAFGEPLINDFGAVAFSAVLKGPGVVAGSERGIWWGMAETPELLARTNAFVPNSQGEPTTARWAQFDSFALPSGPSSGPVLVGRIRGPGVTARNNAGIWAVDSGGRFRELLRSGDSVEGKPIASLQCLSPVPGSLGASRGYNERGAVVARVKLLRGGHALVRIDIPDGLRE